MTTQQITRVVVGCVMAVALLLSGGCTSEGDGSSSPEAPPRPDVTVKALRLVQEFRRNELRADMKYQGKVVKVTGTVNKVDEVPWSETEYVLRLGGGGRYGKWTINCHHIPRRALVKVERGQRVTLIGRFNGGGDLGVELSRCRLTGPKSAVRTR